MRTLLHMAVIDETRGKKYPSATAITPKDCWVVTAQNIADTFFHGNTKLVDYLLSLSDAPEPLDDLTRMDKPEILSKSTPLWAAVDVDKWLNKTGVLAAYKYLHSRVKH